MPGPNLEGKYPLHRVPKDKAHFFISLCCRDGHTYLLAGYTDTRDGSVHHLANFGINNKIKSKQNQLPANQGFFLSAVESVGIHVERALRESFGWNPAKISSESYLMTSEEYKSPIETPSKISSLEAIRYKTYPISYEQYQHVIAQLQHIDDEQQNMPDLFIEQYKQIINEMLTICQQRLAMLEKLTLPQDSRSQYEKILINHQEKLHEWHRLIIEKPQEFLAAWENEEIKYQKADGDAKEQSNKQAAENAARAILLREPLRRYHQALDAYNKAFDDKFNQYLKQTNKTTLESGEENTIRNRITRELFDEEISAPVHPDNHINQNFSAPNKAPLLELNGLASFLQEQKDWLATNQNHLPKNVFEKLKEFHLGEKRLHEILERKPEFYLFPQKHESRLNYYFNTAPCDSAEFEFTHSANENSAYPENTPAAKTAANIPLENAFNMNAFLEINQYRKNCKFFCLEFLKLIGIDDPELSQTSIYDLPEVTYVSHFQMHNFNIETPFRPLPEWKLQNPYQARVLNRLYKHLMSMQKDIDREKHLINTVKNALKDRIHQKLAMQNYHANLIAGSEVDQAAEQELANSRTNLSFNAIKNHILTDRSNQTALIDKPLPDNHIRGILNFPFDTEFHEYLPTELKQKIQTFLEELEQSSNDANPGNPHAHDLPVFSMNELNARLDQLIESYVPENRENYSSLCQLYVKIAENLRSKKGNTLDEIIGNEATDFLEQNYSSLNRHIQREQKKEANFFNPYRALKNNLEAINHSHGLVYTDGQRILRTIEKLHSTRGCQTQKLINAMKATNEMINVLRSNSKDATVKCLCKKYRAMANKISSSNSSLGKLGAAMLTFAGTLMIAAGVASFILTAGASTPISAGLVALGGMGAGIGTGLLLKESKAMTFFSQAAHDRHQLAKQLRKTNKDVLLAAQTMIKAH